MAAKYISTRNPYRLSLSQNIPFLCYLQLFSSRTEIYGVKLNDSPELLPVANQIQMNGSPRLTVNGIVQFRHCTGPRRQPYPNGRMPNSRCSSFLPDSGELHVGRHSDIFYMGSL